MSKLGIVVLAAGQGKRMRSDLPKVLHPIAGLPLLHHILYRILEVAPQVPIAVVVGHGREKVEASVKNHPVLSSLPITFVTQGEQKGTGHAVRCAMDSPWGEKIFKDKASVLVLPGDQPLISAKLLRQMMEPLGRSHSLRLLTCELPDPKGYGRVVRRGKKGAVLRIVEEKDANAREKAIREVGVSIYLFQSSFLRAGLQKLNANNAQKEYYLTDLVAQAGRSSKGAEVLIWPSFEDVKGINDPWELAEAHRLVNQRLVRSAAERGVRFWDPHSVWIDAEVEVAEGVEIAPGAILQGRCRIGKSTKIGPYVVLKNTEVSENVELKTGTTAEDSVIGKQATLGPYCHLRPGSKVGAQSKIGNFVELKNTSVGEETSVAHLSYLGDASVGSNVNIGCGFVTCNYDGRVIDGRRKHPTVIEDGAFVGSDCQTVAPVKIGAGAYVASGSTITEDVEAGSLAIARSRQVNKPGYAKKLKPTSSG